MWVDLRTQLSDAQAVTADAVSTNVYNVGGDFNVGKGQDLYVVITVDVATDDTTGDETYVVELQTASDEAFSSPSVVASVNIPRGTPAGSNPFVLRVPQETLQYLRLNYNVGGTTPTGTFTAWITDHPPHSWEALPDAVN